MRLSRYRRNWWETSYYVRAEAGFECERCGAPERQGPGRSLTVNELIPGLGDITLANLAALCRSCQGKVRARGLAGLAGQLGLFDEGEIRWLRPHLEGLGLPVPHNQLTRGLLPGEAAFLCSPGGSRRSPRANNN